MAACKIGKEDASGIKQVAALSAFVTCIKLMLLPSYRSTDFEVHRNWLAITHSLPLSEWYRTEISPWTLDYPPFFAWFEYMLSIPASWVDSRMVDVERGLNYASPTVVLFQRFSVILTDAMLIVGAYLLCNGMSRAKRGLVLPLVILSPGLLIVDHIHFQYNGFLLGILLLSLAALRAQRNVLAAFLFACLLCLKHLFAVAGPFMFVFLLRHYCWPAADEARPGGQPASGWRKGCARFALLGTVVVAVFGLAFGPFVAMGQISLVLGRLFPFGRGLCHAYWAPNLWALYNVLDKALAVTLRAAGVGVQSTTASFTGGLVGHSDSTVHAVLPQVRPAATAALVLLSMLPSLVRVWRRPQPSEAARWASHALLCGFMFGWHVHEKAALTALLPLTFVATESWADAKQFLFLATVATYSLFPLLFRAEEYPIKVMALLLYVVAAHKALLRHFDPDDGEGASSGTTRNGVKQPLRRKRTSFGGTLFNAWEVSYLCGLIGVEIFCQILHPFLFHDRLPFLPLLLVSLYCSLGFMYVWLLQVMCAIAPLKELRPKKSQ